MNTREKGIALNEARERSGLPLVYVSAGSSEVARAESLMAVLRELGHEITHDWTVDVRAFQRGEHVDARLAAGRDLTGVRRADAVIALVPELPTKGLWYELGYAYSCGIPACIVGPEGCADIWGTLHNHAASVEDALRWLQHIDEVKG